MNLWNAFRRRSSPSPRSAPVDDPQPPEASGGTKDRADELERAIARHEARDRIINATPVDVEPSHRAHLLKIAAWVATRLGADTPRLKFFARPGGSLINGLCLGDGTVWVARDLEGDKAAGVAIHETLHHARPDWDHERIWRETKVLLAELGRPVTPAVHPTDAASTEPRGRSRRISEWG